MIRSYSPVEIRDDIGKLWENFIISEIKKKYNNGRKLVNSLFWRTVDKKEIDYIEEENLKIKAFQIKWSPTAKAKMPTAFRKTYNDLEINSINKENFWEYLIKF